MTQNKEHDERFEEHPISTEFDDRKAKFKLSTLWNNMRYGWSVKMKTHFSKDSPVWLLGRCYRKLTSAGSSRNSTEIATDVAGGVDQERDGDAAIDEDDSMEAFKLDFYSKIWFTYRQEMPVVGDSQYSSDCGWGCMLRSGQMILAQALVCHLLSRDWRWRPELGTHWNETRHRTIVRLFGDRNSLNCPFSIHTLCEIGCLKYAINAGEWYGPVTVAHILQHALVKAQKEESLLDSLVIYVAQDSSIYLQDVIDECSMNLSKSCRSPSECSDNWIRSESNYSNYLKHSNWNASSTFTSPMTCERDKETSVSSSNLSDVEEKTAASDGLVKWTRSLILLVPVRLGVTKFNTDYATCLTALLSLDCCIGIIGGKPKHSLYFVGYQDDKLINLDPHYCQTMVDVSERDFSLASFHCDSPRKTPINKIDPSCCVGFYCPDYMSLVNLMRQLSPPNLTMTNDSGPLNDTPIFTFCPGSRGEAYASASVTSQLHKQRDEQRREYKQHPHDDSINVSECEQFEFL